MKATRFIALFIMLSCTYMVSCSSDDDSQASGFAEDDAASNRYISSLISCELLTQFEQNFEDSSKPTTAETQAAVDLSNSLQRALADPALEQASLETCPAANKFLSLAQSTNLRSVRKNDYLNLTTIQSPEQGRPDAPTNEERNRIFSDPKHKYFFDLIKAIYHGGQINFLIGPGERYFTTRAVTTDEYDYCLQRLMDTKRMPSSCNTQIEPIRRAIGRYGANWYIVPEALDAMGCRYLSNDCVSKRLTIVFDQMYQDLKSSYLGIRHSKIRDLRGIVRFHPVSILANNFVSTCYTYGDGTPVQLQYPWNLDTINGIHHDFAILKNQTAVIACAEKAIELSKVTLEDPDLENTIQAEGFLEAKHNEVVTFCSNTDNWQVINTVLDGVIVDSYNRRQMCLDYFAPLETELAILVEKYKGRVSPVSMTNVLSIMTPFLQSWAMSADGNIEKSQRITFITRYFNSQKSNVNATFYSASNPKDGTLLGFSPSINPPSFFFQSSQHYMFSKIGKLFSIDDSALTNAQTLQSLLSVTSEYDEDIGYYWELVGDRFAEDFLQLATDTPTSAEVDALNNRFSEVIAELYLLDASNPHLSLYIRHMREGIKNNEKIQGQYELSNYLDSIKATYIGSDISASTIDTVFVRNLNSTEGRLSLAQEEGEEEETLSTLSTIQDVHDQLHFLHIVSDSFPTEHRAYAYEHIESIFAMLLSESYFNSLTNLEPSITYSVYLESLSQLIIEHFIEQSDNRSGTRAGIVKTNFTNLLLNAKKAIQFNGTSTNHIIQDYCNSIPALSINAGKKFFNKLYEEQAAERKSDYLDDDNQIIADNVYLAVKHIFETTIKRSTLKLINQRSNLNRIPWSSISDSELNQFSRCLVKRSSSLLYEQLAPYNDNLGRESLDKELKMSILGGLFDILYFAKLDQSKFNGLVDRLDSNGTIDDLNHFLTRSGESESSFSLSSDQIAELKNRYQSGDAAKVDGIDEDLRDIEDQTTFTDALCSKHSITSKKKYTSVCTETKHFYKSGWGGSKRDRPCLSWWKDSYKWWWKNKCKPKCTQTTNALASVRPHFKKMPHEIDDYINLRSVPES